nr:hypothetical protein CFP56_02858 [Quercus suber]
MFRVDTTSSNGSGIGLVGNFTVLVEKDIHMQAFCILVMTSFHASKSELRYPDARREFDDDCTVLVMTIVRLWSRRPLSREKAHGMEYSGFCKGGDWAGKLGRSKHCVASELCTLIIAFRDLDQDPPIRRDLEKLEPRMLVRVPHLVDPTNAARCSVRDV